MKSEHAAKASRAIVARENEMKALRGEYEKRIKDAEQGL